MRTCLAVLAIATALSSTAAFAATRSFTVTGFDRVRVDGPFKVVLTTNVAPYARATGSAAALDGISVDVEGQTLIIRPKASGWTNYPDEATGPVTVSIGTHDLERAWVNGSGSLAVDKVRGPSLDLAVQGVGSVEVGEVRVDQLQVGMSGSGSAVISGTAQEATAIVRGASSLDASALTAKNATVGAAGTAVVKLSATRTVKIDAKGPVSIELSGNPVCTVRSQGSAEIHGCH